MRAIVALVTWPILGGLCYANLPDRPLFAISAAALVFAHALIELALFYRQYQRASRLRWRRQYASGRVLADVTYSREDWVA